ncbi:MAG: GNAT family N-acetyltransferase [Chloroflexota bacterium]
MQKQTSTTDEALVTAIRANLCALYRSLAGNPSPGNKVKWTSSLPHPWFNGILVSQPPTPEDETYIQEMIQTFKEHKVESFTWWLEPHLSIAEWEPFLSKHGFIFSNDIPGMAIDLKDMTTPMPTIDGFEIQAVTNTETLQDWVNAFAPGYGLPLEWKPFIFETWSSLGLDLPVRNYIGYLHGKAVATSCLFLGGGVAGIYSVSTLPEARGKSIGLAMTVKPLHDARDLGYRIATLQSSKMGFNIYKKIGFKHLCQIEHFYYVNQ